MADEMSGLRKKLTLRLVAPLAILLFLNSLDRANISFAALHMNEDLSLTPQMYGFAFGIFFVSYMLFQLPHTAILRRIGARRWVVGTVLLWGTVAASMAFVQDATQLNIARFALGVAEGGFAPGATYLCSIWMPQRFRARAIAGTMLSVPFGVIIGAPLSTWLMTHATNPMGLAGWRWMMLVEGSITLVFGVLAFWVFSDRPADARWLTDREKAWIDEELARERAEKAGGGLSDMRGLLRSGRLWLSALVWFALLAGAQGLMAWLPQIVKQMSDLSDMQVGFVTALPWVGVGTGMVLNSWHSDKTQERYWHVGLAALLGAIGFAGAVMAQNQALALALLVIGCVGMGGAQGSFWTIPTSFMGAAALGVGITLINLAGNSAGLIMPTLIGFVRDHTGSFVAPFWMMASMILLAAATVAALRALSPARPA